MIINKIKKILYFILKYFFRLFPVNKKKILFINFFAQGYGSNPKYITNELLNNNENNLKIVWLLNDTSIELDKKIKKVKYPSFKALYEYTTSKFIVYNIRNFHLNKKRKGQIYLQTWHGTGAFKKAENEAVDKLSNTYIKEAIYDGKVCDAVISDSKNQDEFMEKDFWLNSNAEILKIGLPLYDDLIKNNKREYINFLKSKFNINKDCIVVLYAPTFRDNGDVNCYIKNFEKIYLSYKKIYNNKEIIILVKYHPNVDESSIKIENKNYLIKCDKNIDIRELTLISDFIISDYSGVLYDFLLLCKPGFRYVKDIELYDNIRGIPKKYYEYPFPISYSIDELCDHIKKYDQKKFYDSILEFNKNNPNYNDGYSSKRVVEWINNKYKNGGGGK